MENKTEQNKGQNQRDQTHPIRSGPQGRRIQKLVLLLAAAAMLAGVTGCMSTYDRSAARVMDDKAVSSRVKRALAREPIYKLEDVNISTHNGIVQLSGWAFTDDQREQAGHIASRTPGVAEVINNISLKPVPTGFEDGYAYRSQTNNPAYRSGRNNTAYRSDRDNNTYRSDRDYGTPRSDVDNTRRNVRDRADGALTPGDQGNSPADREITQKIRKALVIDSSGYSMTAKNIKIITINGKVTLRGPVNTSAEKSGIVTIAKNVAGDGNVDDQLEVKANP